MKDIVIIGAGGFGREIAWLIEDINKVKNEWNILGFIDDSPEMQGSKVGKYKVIGNLNWLKDKSINVVCAIGDPLIKKKVMDSLQDTSNEYPVLIHPSVIISDSVTIGPGTIICASNTITVDISIGSHVIINIDSTIGHDVVIENFVTVLPSVNVSGNTVLKECSSIGTGSAIIQGLQIGENSIIGAGSVVVKDIPSNVVAVGSPAKPIKYL